VIEKSNATPKPLFNRLLRHPAKKWTVRNTHAHTHLLTYLLTWPGPTQGYSAEDCSMIKLAFYAFCVCSCIFTNIFVRAHIALSIYGLRTVDRPTVYENSRLPEDWNFRDPFSCRVCICSMFMSFDKCRLLAHNATNPVTRQSGGGGGAGRAKPSLPISRLQPRVGTTLTVCVADILF